MISTEYPLQLLWDCHILNILNVTSSLHDVCNTELKRSDYLGIFLQDQLFFLAGTVFVVRFSASEEG